METVKEVTVGNRTVKIVADDSAESPREWDNLSKMIFVGKHKHLGDNHKVDFSEGFSSREDFITRGEEIVRKHFKDVAICFPVHLYEHSGASISISNSYPYNCQWDSGTIGFAVVTKSDIRENWSIKSVTKKYIEQAEKVLRGEVETLDNYISGEVYGYSVEDENGNEIDSCSGFYGSDFATNGIADYLDAELVEGLIEAV